MTAFRHCLLLSGGTGPQGHHSTVIPAWFSSDLISAFQRLFSCSLKSQNQNRLDLFENDSALTPTFSLNLSLEARFGRQAWAESPRHAGRWGLGCVSAHAQCFRGLGGDGCTLHRKQSRVKAVPGPAIWVTGELWTQQVLLKALEVRSPEPHVPRL